MTQESTPVVLSEANLKLLENLCAKYGTEDEVHKDPNLVLNELLREIERRKDSVSATLSPILRESLSHSRFENIRRHKDDKAA